MQKSIEKIIQKVAQEQGVTFEVAKAVWESQNMCTRLKIAVGEHDKLETFLNIRWRNFGSFIVKPYKFRAINKYVNKDGKYYKGRKNI